MKKLLIIGCCAAALTACHPSVRSYEQSLNSWLGKSEADLVATMGAPAQMETIAPNRQIFVYIEQKQVQESGASMPDSFLGQGSLYTQNNDALGTVYDYFCKTIFTTQNDIVVDYSWEGDGCLAN